MADRAFTIDVKIDGDSVGFQSMMKGLVGEVRELRKDMAELSVTLRDAASELRIEAQAASDLTREFDVASAAVRDMTAAQEHGAIAAEAEARAIDNAGDAAVRAAVKMEALSAARPEIGRQLSAFKVIQVLPNYQGSRDQISLLDHEFSKVAESSARAGEQLSMFGIATGKLDANDLAPKLMIEAAAFDHLGDSAQRAGEKVVAAEAASRFAGAGGALSTLMFGGGGGGGGGGRRRLPGWGGAIIGGAAGLTGFNLLSMLGLGGEHILGAAASTTAFAAQGLAGGGLLGLGAAGTIGVGGGSDLAVMKSTISDTKTLFTAYENLQKAVEIYGRNTRQAALAQAQLNFQVQTLGPGAKFELELAKSMVGLDKRFDELSGKARQEAVAILDQGVSLGNSYLPRVLAAAERNLNIINNGIKPLFEWLKGPSGVKVWDDLENRFASNLPHAVHAFDQAIELLLRVMDIASARTGGFTRHLDDWFSAKNSQSMVELSLHVNRLIDDFDKWVHLIHLVGADIRLAFKDGSQEGQALIGTVTQWLQKLHDWESSTRGQDFLKQFFAQRKDEMVALLHILPPIAKAFASMYASIQPLVPVITLLANGLAAVLRALRGISPAASLAMGSLLIGAKIFGAGALVGGLKQLGVRAGGGTAGTAAAATVAEAAAIGPAVATTVEAGAVGGMTAAAGKLRGFVTKAGPFLRTGLAIYFAGAVLDGLGTAFNGDVARFLPKPTSGLGVSVFGKQLGAQIQQAAMSGISGIEKLASNIPGGSFFVGLLEKIGGQSQTVGERVSAMKQQIIGLGTALQTAFQKGSWQDVDRITNSLQQLANRGIPALDSTIAPVRDLQATLGNIGNTTPAQVSKIWQSFQNARNIGGSAVENLRSIVQTNMQTIKTDVGTKSADARGLLAFNFKSAADYMLLNYKEMGVATQKAMQFINQQLVDALKALGVSHLPKSISHSTSALNFLIAGSTGGVSAALAQPGTSALVGGPQAQGGILGSSSAAGTDKYHVVVGEGEAIVTRHQRAALDRALPRGMTVAGTIGAIPTPHYAATGFVAGELNRAATGGLGAPGSNSTGGYIYPFAPSLSYGRTDEGLDMAGAGDIATIGRAQFTRVSPQNSGTGWPGAAGKGTGAMLVYQLLDGAKRGAYVYLAENVDPLSSIHSGSVVPAGSVYARARGFYPFLEEGWSDAGGTPLAHGVYKEGMVTQQGADFAAMIHGLQHGQLVLGGGNFLGGAGGGGLPAVPIPQLKGAHLPGSGLTHDIGQAAANKYLAAAQSYVNSAGAQINAGRTTGGTSTSGIPSAGAGSWQAEVSKLSKQMGWSEADWLWIIAAESGNPGQLGTGNPQSMNSIGAYGLGQFIPINYGHYGPGSDPGQHPTGVQEVDSMAAYIKQRYGNPSAAKQYHLGHNSYAKGGITGHEARKLSKPKRSRNYSPPGTRKLPKTHARKPPKLTGVKSVPKIPGLNPGFSYHWDDHAVSPNVLTNTFQDIGYLGGNAAAIARATGPDWDYLTGTLGLIDDTDPTTGAPLQSADYVYPAGTWWNGDAGNPEGFNTVWKDDQQIAARLGVLQMESVEEFTAGAERDRLNGYVNETRGQTQKLVNAAIIEKANIDKWQAKERFLKIKRERQDFAREREHIHTKFRTAMERLVERGLRKNLSLDTLYNTAHRLMEDQKREELVSLESAAVTNIKLDPVTVQLERNQIDADFAGQLTRLTQQRETMRTSGAITKDRAKLFLQNAESDALLGITEREQRYSREGGLLGALIATEKPKLQGKEDNAKLLITDLLAADQGALGSKLTKDLLKLNLDASQIFAPTSAGGGDIKSEIEQRMAQLADDTRIERDVTIAGLKKNRNLVATQQVSTSTSGADNSLALQLAQQVAQYAAIDLRVAQQQLATLAGFTPVLGQMVGSFAKGGPITQTGMALVHRGEHIVPDPQGPYGSLLMPQGGGASHVEVNLHGSLAVLEPMIEVIVDKVAQRVVSQQTGRRTRILSGAPGSR